MTELEKTRLAFLACHARMGIITSTNSAKAGHPGGSLSAVDLITYLYSKELRADPKNPKWEDRDRFVLSKGHAAPALYAVLANLGYFPTEDLLTLRHIDSYLQGHPNMNLIPGIDMSTGSLGQGISAAAGMAKGAKYLGKDTNVYAVLGDGEINEGQVWEAFMFSSHYKLDNLCVFIDLNGLQIDGTTADVMSTAPVDAKMAAFGFDVISIDGHDYDQMEAAMERFHQNAGSGKPTAVLMHTMKGKGISYMENVCDWHGKAPSDEECRIAMLELKAQVAEIKAALKELEAAE